MVLYYILDNDCTYNKLNGGDNIADIGEKVIGIGLGLFVAGCILPIGLEQLSGATWTDVDPAVKAMATVLLPVLGVVSIAYAFYKA
jgi:hypothetical protein